MKTLAILTGITFLSFMASASVMSNNKSSNSEAKHFYTPAAMTYRTLALEARPLSEASLEISTEKSLEVEAWMINESLFTAPLPAVEAEESLEVETWMLNLEMFVDTLREQESEKALEVEAWMLDESIWGR